MFGNIFVAILHFIWCWVLKSGTELEVTPCAAWWNGPVFCCNVFNILKRLNVFPWHYCFHRILFVSRLISVSISKTWLPKESLKLFLFLSAEIGGKKMLSCIQFKIQMLFVIFDLYLWNFRTYSSSGCLYFQYSKQAFAVWVLSYVWFWCKDSGFGWKTPLDALRSAEGFCFYQNTGRTQVCYKLLYFCSISHFLEENAIANVVKIQTKVVQLSWLLNCRHSTQM